MKSRILLTPVILLLLTAGPAWTASKPYFDPAKNPSYRFLGGNPPRWESVEPNEFAPDPILGFVHNAGHQVRHINKTRDELIWDVTLTFDKYGSRVTHQTGLEKRKKFLAFFGCSFTLGTGLNDDETFPYFTAQRIPTHHVYNLAIGASAANMMLALIEETPLRERLKERTGVFVYVPIYDHIGRANGYYQELSWMFPTPHYGKDSQGILRRDGTLKSARPWRSLIYGWLHRAQDRFFSSVTFNWPPVSLSHVEYACDLITQSAKSFEERFPGSKFVVVNHPLHYDRPPELFVCLRARGVTVLQPKIPYDPANQIRYDGHPSRIFNERFADVLGKILAPYLN